MRAATYVVLVAVVMVVMVEGAPKSPPRALLSDTLGLVKELAVWPIDTFKTVRKLFGSSKTLPPPCKEVLIVSDPQIEHTSNMGLTKHPYSDVVMSAILQTINSTLAKGCPVFITAHMFRPNSCRFLSFKEALDPAILSWVFGAPLLYTLPPEEPLPPRKRGKDEFGGEPTDYAHMLGGGQSLAKANKERFLRARKAEQEGEEPPDDDGGGADEEGAGAPKMKLCKFFPPALRGRCNSLRDPYRFCDPKHFPPPKWPPMLVPGQGATLDTRLVAFVDRLPKDYRANLFTVIKGLNPSREPKTWSALEPEVTCVLRYNSDESLNALHPAFDVTEARPTLPEENQTNPGDARLLKWHQEHSPDQSRWNWRRRQFEALPRPCYKPLKSFLREHANIEKIVLMGYALELTIRDTVRDLHEFFSKVEEDYPGAQTPAVHVRGATSVAVFPEEFDWAPPRNLALLPVKASMQSLAEEFAMRGVRLEADYLLSGVRLR